MILTVAIFLSFILALFLVGLVAARSEARQRGLFCVNCDHTMLMHSHKVGFCRSYNVLQDRMCRCLGGHEFVGRSQRA